MILGGGGFDLYPGGGFETPPARAYDIEMVDTICTGTCFVYNAGFVVVYLIEFIFFTIVWWFFKMTKKWNLSNFEDSWQVLG